MRIITLFVAIVLVWTIQLHAQDQKKQDPDEQIIVNKRYDEQGNLMEYDSTYIHQWSSDSTFHFSMPDDLFRNDGFPDLRSFMNQFFNDSSMFGLDFPGFSGAMPFGRGDDFSGDFGHGIPDSLLNGFFLNQDSLLFDFRTDSTLVLPPDFSFPGMDEFMKKFQENFNMLSPSFPGFPDFKNDSQRKEWEELMKKQRREMEDLQKKWKEQ